MSLPQQQKDLLRLFLKITIFIFKEKPLKQKQDTANSTKLAPLVYGGVKRGNFK